MYLSLRDRSDHHRWPADGKRSDQVLALSWALVLESGVGQTTLHIRLRVARSSRRWRRTVEGFGGLFDWVTIVLLHRGLQERLREQS